VYFRSSNRQVQTALLWKGAATLLDPESSGVYPL